MAAGLLCRKVCLLGFGISIGPGPIFTSEPRFQNFIRLQAALPWSPELERAIWQLGESARELAATRPGRRARPATEGR